MKTLMRLAVLIAVFGASLPAQTAPNWTGHKEISYLQVMEHGGFLISFTTPLSTPCASAGPTVVYIYPGMNAMSVDGVKAHYATALAAYLSGKKINVMYDDASTYCWGAYIVIQ